jgi:hypothetical protein
MITLVYPVNPVRLILELLAFPGVEKAESVSNL